jgi:hypothetical protein
MQSPVDTTNLRALGWTPKHDPTKHVQEFVAAHKNIPQVEKRILVFSTTFYPIGGPAEKALMDVIEAMPGVQFDIITSRYVKGAEDVFSPLKNATVYRVGKGNPRDKYRLPILGARKARELMGKHHYLFLWSLLASYGGLAAALARRAQKEPLPLLITLADQQLPGSLSLLRLPLRFVLGSADQISSTSEPQEEHVSRLAPAAAPMLSNRSGDAFANQVRILYNSMLKKYR